MKSEKKRCTAVLLAGGSGKRMKSSVAKQFMMLDEKPLIWYALQTIQESKIIDDCILVSGADDITDMRQDIVEKYSFSKVDRIVAGGRERCESVYKALGVIAAGDMKVPNRDGYLFIHDGARPFLTEKILEDTYRQVCVHRACVAAVPAKDTIKIGDKRGFAVETPDRNSLWAVQTPQVFETGLITEAYRKLFNADRPQGTLPAVTDDAMVVERMLGVPVKLVSASYGNIKITTPEDMGIARVLLSEKGLEKASGKNLQNF